MDSKKHEVTALAGVLLLALLIGALPLAAEDPLSDTASAGCIQRLEIPHYTVFSRSARLTGTAETLVMLDSSGKLTKVIVSGVPEILQKEVSENMDKSTFSPQCAGKTLHLVFTYELVGQEMYGIGPGEITFMAPNRFLIRNNPPMIMVD